MFSRIKLSVLLAIVVGLMSCVGGPKFSTINRKIQINETRVPMTTMLRSTVRVNKGGSGVVIYKDKKVTYILTAWHVVKKLVGLPNFLLGSPRIDIKPVSVEIMIMNLDGNIVSKKTYYGAIDASSSKHDLALIRIDKSINCTVTPLAYHSPLFGERVWVIGNPLGRFHYTVTSGVVSHPKRKYKGEYYLQVDAGIIFGNSGGPIFDNGGRLVGIVNAVFFVKGPTHLGVAVPIYTIRDFLKTTGRVTPLFKKRK